MTETDTYIPDRPGESDTTHNNRGCSADTEIPVSKKKEKGDERVRIHIFTDPMMGLSYECEPIFRKLETHFPGKLEVRYVMSLLVRDIHDFMTWDELSRSPEEKFARYNKRLAGIYKQEEKISGMPVNMDGFCLFDETHTTTLSLNLAYKAVEQIAPEQAEAFLYLMRYATIVETRPTTRFDEILKLVRRSGIDEKAFIRAYNSAEVRRALEKDLEFGQMLGIRGLPAYYIEYRDQARFVNGLIGYEAFVSIIEDITGGEIRAQEVVPSADEIRKMMSRHPLICSVELMNALDLKDEEEVKKLLEPFVQQKEIAIEYVHRGWFVRVGI